jgi:hypothetical protein
MKPTPKILALGFYCLLTFTCTGQSLFSFGVKNALGVSPNKLNATLTSESNVAFVRPTIHYVKGLALQYVISNTIGIETGLHLTFYHYRQKGEQFFSSNNIEVNDVQVPLLLVFKKKHEYNAFREFKFLMGTSVDWIESSGLPEQKGWLKNLIAGIRIGSSNSKNGRIEYGLEYQYSLSRFSVPTDHYDKNFDYIDSRLNLLSINLVCYFLNKRLGRVDP